MDFLLVASSHGRTARESFSAEDELDGTLHAIQLILNKATKSKMWSKGRIELYSDNQGELALLRTMNAKA